MHLQRFTGVAMVCLLSITFLVVPVFAKDSEVQPELVARVGSIAITKQDLDRELQKLIPMNFSFHGGVKPETVERLRNEARQNLISRAYKVQYAINEEITVGAQKVETEWQNFYEKNEKRLTDASPADLSRLKAELYLNLLAEEAEKVAVDTFVKVDDAEVKDYYDENKHQFLRPQLYEASHILIKVDPASSKEERAQLKSRADTLYERAQSGEDFYNLAYYESDDRSKYVGGKLGSFHAGQTVAEFDQALKGMASGEISEPVKTMYGYHIIRLDSVEPKRQLSFDEAAVLIRANMEKKLRQEIYDEWMTSLQAKYPLEEMSD